MPSFPHQPQTAPTLTRHTVQVWRIYLDLTEAETAHAAELLSPDERERAERFLFPHLRTRFITARTALRQILGARTGTDPAALAFAYTQNSKPYLPDSRLRFNVAHSHQLALIACSLEREIGVDIEFHRPLPDRDQLAQRFFASAEAADFFACPPEQRSQAFFNCWTRKEAYIKATGDGLSFPLHAFRVSLKPGEEARLLEVAGHPAEAQRWKMAAIDPGLGYTGALLAEGMDWEFEMFEFEPADQRIGGSAVWSSDSPIR